MIKHTIRAAVSRRRIRRSDTASKNLPRRPAPEIDIEVPQVLARARRHPTDRRHANRSSGADRCAACRFRSSRRGPCALSLYGGLPITTVIGSARLIALACPPRTRPSGRRLLGMYSCLLGGVAERVGEEEARHDAFGSGRRRVASDRATSAVSRSCATANGPNCISKPMSRADAARITPGTAPAPWSSLPSRRCGAARQAGRCRFPRPGRPA